MNKIYFAIPALALFSDTLLKRFMSGGSALAAQYMLALVILLGIILVNRDKQSQKPSALGAQMSFIVYYLIAAYCLGFIISIFDVPLLYSLTHVLYIGIPLLYIPIIICHCTEFDLAKFGNIFLLLMIPINLVGFIQYTVAPDFLISPAYSEEGGIILRGLQEGFFVRYPSLFASADRYSAIGLMQFYFAIVLLSVSMNKMKKINLWVYFNLISGIAALIIAGARSRMFIVIALIILMALSVLLFKVPRSLLLNRLNKSLVATLIILVACIFIFAYALIQSKKSGYFPSLEFLITSIQDKDVEYRVGHYIRRTSFSDVASWTGEGLGSRGIGGKPAEIGIESIWIECGIIVGSLILIGFSGITLILVLLSFRAFIRGHPWKVCVFGLPALALLTGLLTGLTSVFELSSGILLMSAIGGVLRTSGRFSHRTRAPFFLL